MVLTTNPCSLFPSFIYKTTIIIYYSLHMKVSHVLQNKQLEKFLHNLTVCGSLTQVNLTISQYID